MARALISASGWTGFLAEDQDVEGIVIFRVGLRDEAVVGRVEDRGMDDAIDLEQAGGLVEFILHIGARGISITAWKVAG